MPRAHHQVQVQQEKENDGTTGGGSSKSGGGTSNESFAKMMFVDSTVGTWDVFLVKSAVLTLAFFLVVRIGQITDYHR